MSGNDYLHEVDDEFDVEQENRNWEELLKVINNRAREIAKKECLESNLPLNYDWPLEISGLSCLDQENYYNNIEELSFFYDDDINKLLAYADLVREYACHVGAAIIRLKIEHEIYPDNDYTRLCGTPEGFLDNDRVTPIFLSEIGGSNPNPVIIAMSNLFGFKKKPDEFTLLKALDCVWLKLASDQSSDSAKVFMMLAEARMALEIHSGLSIIDKYAKNKSEEEIISEARSSIAKKGASARHAENRAIKLEVMKWLDENKTLDLNGDETANEIAGKVAPIKWRTARDYITEWKKLRSTGRP